MQKTSVKLNDWLALAGVLFHLYWYRYWTDSTREWFFISLYIWIYILSALKLKEKGTVLYNLLYGISTSVSSAFIFIEWMGKPYEEWGIENWLTLIVSILHPLSIFAYFKVRRQRWFIEAKQVLEICVLYITEKTIFLCKQFRNKSKNQ